jgi:hypothetical protein
MKWIGLLQSERYRLLLYPLLGLLTFPVIGVLLAGQNGPAYALDVFDDGGEVPRLAIVVHDWLANGLTLWDPHLTAGNALLGQFSISPFAVDTVLALLIGPFGAWAIVSWLMPTVAGVAMHRFLRDSLRLPTPAVIGGSILYMFGSWHYNYGFSILLLPMFLWLTDRAAQPGGSWRPLVAGSLLGALALYEGLSQCVILMAGIQLAYLVFVHSEGHRLEGIARWIGMWAGAFALFGPVLLTQLVLLPGSQRTIWDDVYLFGATVPVAISTIVEHYAALFTAVPIGGGFGPGEYRYGTLFLGGVGLPLLVTGLVAGRRDRRTVFIVGLLAVIPVLDLAAILIAPVQQNLDPFFKSFQFVRIRHFYPFAITAVAALGIDVLVKADRRWLRSRLRLGLVGLSFVPLVVALWIGVQHVRRAARAPDGLLGQGSGWVLADSALVVGLGGAILIAVLVYRNRARPAGQLTGILLLAGLLLVSERALYASGSALLGPSISSYGTALAETAGERFLAAQPGIAEDRVLTFGDQANRMTIPGFLQADGYQAIYPLSYHDFFGGLIAPQLATNPATADYFDKWGARAYAFGPNIDPELVALAGVRWLYVVGDQVPTVPGIVSRFHAGNVTVYDVPAVLPRAFVAGGVVAEPNDEAVTAALSAASLDSLEQEAYVSDALTAGVPSELLTGVGSSTAVGPAGLATIADASPDRVEVDVHADRAGMLVLTDVMAPGWVAELDGRPVPIVTVDRTFRGVALAAGSHQVVFRYEPTFTYVGFALAALAALILAGWAAWSAWRERRSGRRLPESGG